MLSNKSRVLKWAKGKVILAHSYSLDLLKISGCMFQRVPGAPHGVARNFWQKGHDEVHMAIP